MIIQTIKAWASGLKNCGYVRISVMPKNWSPRSKNTIWQSLTRGKIPTDWSRQLIFCQKICVWIWSPNCSARMKVALLGFIGLIINIWHQNDIAASIAVLPCNLTPRLRSLCQVVSFSGSHQQITGFSLLIRLAKRNKASGYFDAMEFCNHISFGVMPWFTMSSIEPSFWYPNGSSPQQRYGF